MKHMPIRCFAILSALFLIGVTTVHADPAALKEARQRWLRGNYAEAREMYERLAKDGKDRPAALLGVARTLISEGDYDKALATLDAALKDAPKNADLLAQRADVLYERGRWTDAEQAVRQALDANKNQHLAHWVQARLYRDQGDLAKAGEELAWFIRHFQENDVTDPEQILLVGMVALERARWDSRLSDQFQTVLNDFFAPLAKEQPDFWLAEYHSGLLHLEKYNVAYALKHLDKALKINPRAAEALAARAAIALHRFEFKDADLYADEALSVNPRLTEALRIKAAIQYFAGNFAEALKELNKALAVNPRDEATLAQVAAVHFANDKTKEFDAVVADVKKHNRKPGVFYTELAENLESRKLYWEAEKFYKQSLGIAPHLNGARCNLGLLYMRLGMEEEAKPILEAAHKADKFHIRVFNTLKVLDHLESYSEIKTEHFILKYDPKNDKALAHFMAKYLEDIYNELATRFDFRPKGPFLIELFNKHEMFSGRVVNLPDLHTIGACTGRMVAMVSPRDKMGVFGKPFNWARVLRHELVHVFNLEQTKFKVPHWFTEGLAVQFENMQMPPLWWALLRERVGSGELLNLDTINLGFIRPRSPEEWQLAYLQSLLYVELLQKLHGKEAVGGLLQAYADGLSTDAALEKVCKTTKAEFEKTYRQHLETLIEKVQGRPAAKVLSLRELKDRHEKEPDNANIAAQLAERQLLLGDRKEAERLANLALDKAKKQPLASFVLARLALEQKDGPRAVEILEKAVDEKDLNAKVLRLLSKLQFEAKQFEPCAETLKLGRKVDPTDNVWLKDLAKVYTQTNNFPLLTATLKVLAPTDPDDLETRRTLATLLSKADKHAEAEQWARAALEIDVQDEVAIGVLVTSMKAQGKVGELEELLKLLFR